MTPEGTPRIKLAIQKSGRLTDNSLDLLARCGLKYSRRKDQLVCFGENMPLDVLLVRDDDIPALVEDDVCDLGIVGFNVVEERRLARLAAGIDLPFQQLMSLDYGRCRLSIAMPENRRYEGPRSLDGLRIATTYPHLLRRWLDEQQVSAQIVTLSGSVEIAPSLGRAEAICDLVSTGATLAANRLVEAEVVLESQAVLIRTPGRLEAGREEWISRLLLRMNGVKQVRESKYIMLHAPRSALERISALLPGSEHPTIVPLEGTTEKVAVHAVCRENVFWETLEGLKAAGASAILVLPVEKMLP